VVFPGLIFALQPPCLCHGSSFLKGHDSWFLAKPRSRVNQAGSVLLESDLKILGRTQIIFPRFKLQEVNTHFHEKLPRLGLEPRTNPDSSRGCSPDHISPFQTLGGKRPLS
jgi:hypothetical protein